MQWLAPLEEAVAGSEHIVSMTWYPPIGALLLVEPLKLTAGPAARCGRS